LKVVVVGLDFFVVKPATLVLHNIRQHGKLKRLKSVQYNLQV